MGDNSAMTRAGTKAGCGSAPLWRAVHFVPALILTLAATLLALAVPASGSWLVTGIGLLVVFWLPGYFAEQILFGRGGISLTRLPAQFVFSLAIWALPATALQLLGGNWTGFRIVFVLVLWALTVAAIVTGLRANARVQEPDGGRDAIWTELIVAALAVGVVVVVARGPRDADDWMYLQITQQFIGSNPFQLFAKSEARYSIRYAFHVWIFLQAFLGQWLRADAVALVRDVLPVLLAPLALFSGFAWAKTFFRSNRAALATVLIQLAIYVTFVNADGWGRGFFERSAQDKFLVWLVILPLALGFAWNFLQRGGIAHLIAFAAAMLAGLWVHPVSLFLVVLTLAGFALFNLISRTPFSRRRWLGLLVASLPALASPLVLRATTLPAVFRVDTPDVLAYVRLSEGRLLFQPPFYIADPALLAHPLILLALWLLVTLAPLVRRDVRTQFLWGSTLVPLALLTNPFTARILGEMLTPWQLWRMTWNIPAALILTYVGMQLPGWFRAMPQNRAKLALAGAGVLVALLGAFWLSNFQPAKSIAALSKGHAVEAPTADMLVQLTNTLQTPATVLLPRDLTRYAPAYTYNARVLSSDAQKQEDARGQQIDRFYDPGADSQFLDAFLQTWQIDYAVAPNGSRADRFLAARAKTQEVYKNDGLTLYRVGR